VKTCTFQGKTSPTKHSHLQPKKPMIRPPHPCDMAHCLIFLLRNIPVKLLARGLNVGDIEAPRIGTILAYRSETVRPMSPKVKYLFAKLRKKFRVPISKFPHINTYQVQNVTICTNHHLFVQHFNHIYIEAVQSCANSLRLLMAQ